MSLRRWMSRLNLAVTLLLIGALFILVNFIASRRYHRADLTRTKITALSDKTKQVLQHLTEPVSIVVFYQPQTADHRPNPLYPLITDLLKEYERQSANFHVDFVDPYRDRAKAEQLAKQFEIDRLNLVIFACGSRHKYLSDSELADYDLSTMDTTGQPSIKAFKGEDAFTSTLLSVTQTTQPLVWITTGHGEKSLTESQETGLSALGKYLEKANMQTETVTLLEKTNIPPTVGAIVIPGPTRRFLEQETALLDTFLQRGGRLLALLDPLQDTGLEKWLEHWGVEVGNNIVVDPARQLPFVSAANLFITTYTQHPIVEKMQTFMTLFPLARSVKPHPGDRSLKTTSLALTSPQGWGETDTTSTNFKFDEAADLKGPISIAVAVERANTPAATPAAPAAAATPLPPTRVVVIGDSDFATNAQLTNVGNLDLFMGCLQWLVGQEQLIGIGPKQLESIRLHFTDSQMTTTFWLSFAGLPLLMAAFGVGMWWIRRR